MTREQGKAERLYYFHIKNQEERIMRKKIFAGIFGAVIASIFGFIFFISLIFGDFGESNIVQDIHSPNNTYSAVAARYNISVTKAIRKKN